jgi:hypothetical protein
MRLGQISTSTVLWVGLAQALPKISSQASQPSCRFAVEYTQEQILRDPTDFMDDMLYWEGKFHQNNVSYNTDNGMSYDGTNIDWVTGERTLKHPFSAASKEARHPALCCDLSSQLNYVDRRFKSCCMPMQFPAPHKLLASFLLITHLQRPRLPLLSWRPSCRLI